MKAIGVLRVREHPMDAAREIVLMRHGWRRSQMNGGWFRERVNKPTEFANGPYLPAYFRECEKLRKGERL